MPHADCGTYPAEFILLLFFLLCFCESNAFQKIWKPFYATLAAMKQFNLSSPAG
jgi:hypothetical protein